MTTDTPLAEIAQSVAQALDLEEDGNHGGWKVRTNRPNFQWHLALDGSNLFNAHWQVQCRDWLLERGHFLVFDPPPIKYHECGILTIECPAAEFAARAIHELGKPK
jgi:hypothetical protein